MWRNKKQFWAFWKGWAQTWLHEGSSLTASSGSQTGKSSWAQTCLFGWLHEVTSCKVLFDSLAGPPSLSQTTVFCPEMYEIKPPNWSHAPVNYLRHSNKRCSYMCLILCEWLEVCSLTPTGAHQMASISGDWAGDIYFYLLIYIFYLYFL